MTSQKVGWRCEVFALACLLAAYCGILRHYAFGEDFMFMFLDADGRHDYSPFIVSEGRPLFAWTAALLFSSCHGLGGLVPIRMLSLLGVWLFGWQMRQALARWGWSPWLATACATSVCLLPPFTVQVGWANLYALSWSLVLGFGAATLADTAATGRRRALDLTLAVGLEMCALSLYQNTAMIYFLYPAIVFAAARSELGGRRLWQLVGVFMAACLLYLGCYLGQIGPFEHGVSKRAAAATSAVDKVEWFLRRPMVDAIASFVVVDGPQRALACCIGAGLLLLALMYCWRQSEAGWRRLAAAVIFVLFLPLSMLPQMGVRESHLGYRMLASMCAMACFWQYYALSHLLSERAAIRVGMGVTLLGVALAAYNLNAGFIEPRQREYALIRDAVHKEPQREVGSWLYILPEKADSLAPSFCRQHVEFGMPNYGEWSARSIVNVILNELDPSTRHYADVVTCHQLEIATSPPHRPRVIDARRLLRYGADGSGAVSSP